MYKYRFTSTVQDLLDAEEADATERSGLRKILRWAVAVICATGVVAAIEAFISLGYRIEQLIWLVLGSYGVYYFVLSGYVRRHRIRKRNAPSMDISVEFQEDCIEIAVSDYGTYKRDWCELLSYVNAAKGVLLHFRDGTVNWLPNRVFRDMEEKRELIEFIRTRIELELAVYDTDDQ